MTDAKYIRPEDRLYYAAGALKSPSTTPERRRQYLAEAEDALAKMKHDPTIPEHDIHPIGELN